VLCREMTLDLSNRPTLRIGFTVLHTVAFTSIATSVLTIALIFYMRNRKVLRITVYLEMVIAMTIWQALYDLSFFYIQVVCDAPGTCLTGNVLYFTLTSVTTSLWSLLIICCVGWVTFCKRVPPANFLRYCWGIVIVVFIGVFLSMEELMRAGNIGSALHVSSIARLTISFLSLAVILALYLSIFRRSGVAHAKQDPLYHLVRKLVWYPIVHLISRMGGSIYDNVYNRLPSTYEEGSAFLETFLMFIFMILTPSAGIGCGAVFCSIQKGGWICLKRMMLPCIDHGPIPAYLLETSGREPTAPLPSARQSVDMLAAVAGAGGANTEEDQAERLAQLDEEELTHELAHWEDRLKKFAGRDEGGYRGGGEEDEEEEMEANEVAGHGNVLSPIRDFILHPL
jgi:hypothetical protein